MAMAMEISVVGNSIKDKHREGKTLKPFFGLADTDRRKKMSKKLNPLVFTPAQFSSCLESGLNIHTIGTSAGEVITPNNRKKRKLDEYSGEGLGGLKNDDFMKDISWNACGEEKEDDNESVVVVVVEDVQTSLVECTNGAMEALRQCQSAFLSLLSTSLGEQMKDDKEGRSVLTEQHVMSCMEQLGLSNLAERGAAYIMSSREGQEQQHQQPNQKKKRKGGGGGGDFASTTKASFANMSDTKMKELVEEQDRLLSESACRVRTMMMTPKVGKELSD
jgi:hypothetical protein